MSLEIPDKREPAEPSGETNISPGLSGVDGRTVSDKLGAFVTGLPTDWIHKQQTFSLLHHYTTPTHCTSILLLIVIQ